jgi:hypothetical protein
MSRELVAEDLTNYAQSLTRAVSQEYSYWMNKWWNYLDLVADAQQKANDDLTARLTKIKKEQAEAREFMMMAFSVIGIVGAAWIGAMVEMVWFPKLAGKVEYTDKVVTDVFGRNIWTFESKIEYSEIMAKTIGDSIHELTGHGLDKLFELILPERPKNPPTPDGSLLNNIRAAQIASFKTLLDSALRDESSSIIAQLSVLEQSINQHPNFGKAVIQLVESKSPRGFHLDDDTLKNKGKMMLDEYFDALRRKYADKWFYFGNIPNTARIPLLVFNFEVQAWAFWILDQKWEMKYIFSANLRTHMPNPTVFYYTNGDFDLHEIMWALEDFAGDEIQALFYSGDPNVRDELKAVNKLTEASSVERGSLSDNDSERERQAIREKDKVLAWAKSVPGQIEHPNLDFSRRAIGTVKGMKGIYPGIQINR